MLPPTKLNLSGERLTAIYHLTGDQAEARTKADDICIEQTIEFPAALVPDDDIRGHIFGRIEDLQPLSQERYEATISYAVETSGFELTQLFNLLFGNISIKPGVRLMRFELPDSLYKAFNGPRFGQSGLRSLLNIPTRPILCTALKPMGHPMSAMADFAYQFALGGIDIIKDDHGLANQQFAPFKERVERCVEAVARANQETGYRSIYMPNITGPADQILDNARLAKELGAGGFLIAPALMGPDTVRSMADNDDLGLPLMGHPSFQGSYVISPDAGVSHAALYGQMARLVGVDANIFPNYGGRFSFSREECQGIAAAMEMPMGHIKSIFPSPGGGMNVDRIADMREVYGRDVLYLIGGALYQDSDNLAKTARQFRALAEQV